MRLTTECLKNISPSKDVKRWINIDNQVQTHIKSEPAKIVLTITLCTNLLLGSLGLGDLGLGDFGLGDFGLGDLGRDVLDRDELEDTFSTLLALLLRGGDGGRVVGWGGGDLGHPAPRGGGVRDLDRLPEGLLLPYNSLKPLWRHLGIIIWFHWPYLKFGCIMCCTLRRKE